MKTKIVSKLAVLAAPFALTGCVVIGTVEGPGEYPAETPPQLTFSQKDEAYIWDRPSAFGKISPELKAAGDALCKGVQEDLVATGYHPTAKDADGNVLPGGGYFCVRK